MEGIINLAMRIGAAAKEKGLLLSTAESCTGGGVSSAITEVAGSSEWFDCGFVTYSNESKTKLLGVPAELIDRHGSVSEEVAAAMAQGALAQSGANLAVAVTGIAGPGGAVPGKPVGTICFAWTARNGQTHTETMTFEGDRHAVRRHTVMHALHGLVRMAEEA